MYLHFTKICIYILQKFVFTFYKNMYLHLTKICIYILQKYVFTFNKNMYLHFNINIYFINEKIWNLTLVNFSTCWEIS